MKYGKKVIGIVSIVVCVGFWAVLRGGMPAVAQDAAADKPVPTDAAPDMAKVSYCIGLSIGRSMKTQDVTLVLKDFMTGVEHGLTGADPQMTEDEMTGLMQAFQAQMSARQREKISRLAEENSRKGAAFLAENRKKEGVRVLESGLQYKVIREGTGKQPIATDTVSVHYRGTFIDGQEFDSSYRRNEPASLTVGGVIPGWSEALKLMKEGAKWQLVVPSELAYGERGAGGVIPPNAVLVFEVELIKIK